MGRVVGDEKLFSDEDDYPEYEPDPRRSKWTKSRSSVTDRSSRTATTSDKVEETEFTEPEYNPVIKPKKQAQIKSTELTKKVATTGISKTFKFVTKFSTYSLPPRPKVIPSTRESYQTGQNSNQSEADNDNGDGDSDDDDDTLKLNRVVSLHLQKRGLQTIVPSALKVFTSLAHLYLYDNSLVKIEGVAHLPQLESLHLSGNKISRIENLHNSFNLRQLYLGHNEIEVVEGLESLNMLLELHMEHQRLPPQQGLIFCPNSLDTISRKLKVLDVSGDQLDSVDDLMCMEAIDTLNLGKNRFTDLDGLSVVLRTMRQLRVLDLRENGVKKEPKYKEKIVGFCGSIEWLDGKEVNNTQRRSLQRLCSIKALRLRNQLSKAQSAMGSRTYHQQQESQHGFLPMFQDLFYGQAYENVGQQLYPFFNQNQNQDTKSEHQSQQFQQQPDQFNEFQEFQFSTPISSPVPPKQGSGDLTLKPGLKELYNARSPNIQLEEEETESEMSEMAKIIFRLSNLTPSTETMGGGGGGFLGSFPRNPRGRPGVSPSASRSSLKESRPLSPLELDVTPGTSNLMVSGQSGQGGSGSNLNLLKQNKAGVRRSVPLRRPMAKKLPPRRSVGAGRTLSPLEELPTPDSTRDLGSNSKDWLGQSLQTSTCPLPPWPHILRRKAVGPPKVVFLP